MLVLLSMALVLIATVLLVLGLLNDDGLNLIYLSIVSSLAAFGVLVFALRANRARVEERPAAPAPLPDLEPEPVTVGAAAVGRATAIQPSPAPAPVGASTGRGSGEWHASDLDDWSDPADGVDLDADDDNAAADGVAPAAADGWQEGDEVDFPIADYDSLTVGQILPLLPQLYTDEFDVVEERERATKARPQVLAKLAELRDGGVSADPLASYTEPVGTDGDGDDEWFPIEDYESLSAAQIQPLLPELDEEELELVRARELELGRRRSLLDEIDRLLGDAPATVAEPAAKRAAAAKAPARSSASRKAPAKKAPVPARKAPAKRAPASKAPARKAAATSAANKATSSARTAAAKKAAAPSKKAAPAKKAAAPAKKVAAPATKAAPAKKATTAKKATPATKTTTAKKAGKKSR